MHAMYGRLATLKHWSHGPVLIGAVSETPSDAWLSIQNVKFPKEGVWFTAYPMNGGAVCIHESRIEEVGNIATLEDVQCALGELYTPDYNPARDAILKIVNNQQA